MKYCHSKPGKPPADIDWTVTAERCSELHPSPDSGSLTISEGECRDVQVSIPIPDDVCARSDVTLRNSSDGCDKNHKASGKLCILPTGEHSVHERNEVTWAGDWAYFWGYLEPSGADFEGRGVRERRLSASDPCYDRSIPGDYSYLADQFLNKGQWVINAENRYGGPDIIGGGSLFPSLPHREGCEVNGRQLMEIQCGDGSWQPYKTNEVRILFRGMALNSTVIRDGESSH